MTTPRDLFLVVLAAASDRPLAEGDLSLGLAGAEVIDLLAARVVRLDGEELVPMDKPRLGDLLLAEAAASVVRQAPYESLGGWLWRRGRHLSAAYHARLEADGKLTRHRRRRWMVLGETWTEVADSSERRWAARRWDSREPVLDSLCAAVGLHDSRAEAATIEDPVRKVLDAVDDAIAELATERRRRARRLDAAAEYNRERGY